MGLIRRAAARVKKNVEQSKTLKKLGEDSKKIKLDFIPERSKKKSESTKVVAKQKKIVSPKVKPKRIKPQSAIWGGDSIF